MMEYRNDEMLEYWNTGMLETSSQCILDSIFPYTLYPIPYTLYPLHRAPCATLSALCPMFFKITSDLICIFGPNLN